MEAKAVVMGLIGFLLLYGGLACCIGIAWYHSKHPNKKNSNSS
jgi:hypothetical protein